MIRFASPERPEIVIVGLCALNLALAVAMLAVALWPIERKANAAVPNAVPPAPGRSIPPSFAAPSSPLFGRNNIALQPEILKPPPVVAATAPIALPEARDLQWRVTGIIIANAVKPLALIERGGQTPETRRIAMGDEVDGWQVERIAPRVVTFRRGAATVTVALDPASAAAKPN